MKRCVQRLSCDCVPVAIWPDGCDYEQRGDDTTVGRLKVDGNGVCADEPADSSQYSAAALHGTDIDMDTDRETMTAAAVRYRLAGTGVVSSSVVR